MGAKCYLLVGLICISFIANEVESLCFMYLLIISTFFLNIFWVICIFLINFKFLVLLRHILQCSEKIIPSSHRLNFSDLIQSFYLIG